MKKSLTLIFFCFLTIFSNLALAGPEDWHGDFILLSTKGSKETISHHPTYLKIVCCLYIGDSYKISRGGSLNGLVATQDGILKVRMNADDFTIEVQKLGVLLSKQITLGPTYSLS